MSIETIEATELRRKILLLMAKGFNSAQQISDKVGCTIEKASKEMAVINRYVKKVKFDEGQVLLYKKKIVANYEATIFDISAQIETLKEQLDKLEIEEVSINSSTYRQVEALKGRRKKEIIDLLREKRQYLKDFAEAVGMIQTKNEFNFNTETHFNFVEVEQIDDQDLINATKVILN